ncbi:hypothetical protein Sjap_000909 [Stephania japonica]|uniref:Uncharacterized protein n=1 Tax=Stephania japonica TaxID=461633 RepID=A0AAP0PT01_9MAGN
MMKVSHAPAIHMSIVAAILATEQEGQIALRSVPHIWLLALKQCAPQLQVLKMSHASAIHTARAASIRATVQEGPIAPRPVPWLPALRRCAPDSMTNSSP